jgi:hypothetical protein
MTDPTPPEPTEKVALAPDPQSLSDRGLRAWTERMAVRPLGERYAVDSESGATYVVDPVAGTCTCPDQQLRGETCKHLRRVAIEITARRVPPPSERRADCGACGIETFVPSDAEAPPLCSGCALNPGEVVLDRETADRLVVVRVTPDRADEVTIAETGATVATHPTNDGYPSDDTVIEAVYVTDLHREGPRRYSFPRSRLRRTDDAAVDVPGERRFRGRTAAGPGPGRSVPATPP